MPTGNKKGKGRPATTTVVITVSGPVATAFADYMRCEALKMKSVAGEKLIVERLRERGFLNDVPAPAQQPRRRRPSGASPERVL
jgi:hypothetical protein